MSEVPKSAVEPEARKADKLLHKMWRTKSCQFNARLRLERRHWLSVFATSVLSCYLAGGSVYQLAFTGSISPRDMLVLSVVNLLVAIFLIMITLFEAARNYIGASEKMHASALEIAALYNRFQALPPDQMEIQRLQYVDQYSEALRRHNVIHAELDYCWFKIANAGEIQLPLATRIWLLLYALMLSVAEYWLYVALIVLPPLAFYLLMQ